MIIFNMILEKLSKLLLLLVLLGLLLSFKLKLDPVVVISNPGGMKLKLLNLRS